MTKQMLNDAISAIKHGDKLTGKELLVEVLKEEPTNDRAWLWMSAVVETNELRLECLEEALKHNPDNKMAQKGLAKLQKPSANTATLPGVNNSKDLSNDAKSHQSSASSDFPLSQDSRGTIEYFCKRLILEKDYVIHIQDEDPNTAVPVINPDNFLFSIPVGTLAEINEIQRYFDVILFRQTNAGFAIVCLKVCHSKNERPPITQAQLVKVGQACLKYSNAVAYGVVTPILIQVWEIYERGFTKEDEERLQTLKRMPGRKKVGIQTYAIDQLSKKVAFSSDFLLNFNTNKKYIQRLLNEELTFSEEALLISLVNGRIEILPILAGIVVGLVLALALRLFANAMNWTYYLQLDLLIGFFVASIAIYLPKYRLYSHWQGFLATTAYGIILYGLQFLLLGTDAQLGLGLISVFYVFLLALLGRFLGSIAER